METFFVVIAYTFFVGLPALALLLLIHFWHTVGRQP